MSTFNYSKTLALSLFAGLSGVWGVEAPAGEADPKAPATPPPAEVQAEERAYLGIYSMPVPGMLKSHLPLLRERRGALLGKVVEGSPADEGGLKQYDVLLSIDEQAIERAHDMNRYIAEKNPGDAIQLELLREGEIQTLELKLGARPAMPRAAAGPEELFRRLEGFQQADPLENLRGGLIPEKELQALRQRMQQQLQDLEAAPQMFEFNMGMESGMKTRVSDGKGAVEIERSDGDMCLRLYDPEGTLLFEGPFNEAGDLDAIPDDHRERVDELGLTPGKGFNKGPIELRLRP